MWNGACARYCSLIERNISLLYSCIIIIHQGVYNNECDCRTQIIIIIITISHDDVILLYCVKKSFLHTSMTQKSSGPIPVKMTRGIYRYPFIPRYISWPALTVIVLQYLHKPKNVYFYFFHYKVFWVERVRRADRFVPNTNSITHSARVSVFVQHTKIQFCIISYR